MTQTYCIAEKCIEITSIHEDVQMLCRDYRCDAAPDFSVAIQYKDIDWEREKSAAEDKLEGVPTRVYSDGYLETLAVYRRIAEQMLTWDTMLFHGSVIAVDGVGYLFTAKSGTGKSTHTRLWRETFGERAMMVNDDKPLLKILPEGVTVFGTPWDGKHHLSNNISVPLKALCILQRSQENHIEQIKKGDAYTMLLQQAYRPQDAAKLTKTLELIDRLAEKVSLYRLGCNREREAVQVAYNGMKGSVG